MTLGPDGVGFDLGLKFSYKKKKKIPFWVFVCKENFEGPGIFWGKKNSIFSCWKFM